MADDERGKKFVPSRRTPQQYRPTPGVQKAIQTFGVRDLREFLDKKRQDQGESHSGHSDKKPPPRDPSYNYLKDPTRDKPRLPQRKPDHEKQYDRPIARDREINPQQGHYRDEKHSRNRETVPQEERNPHKKEFKQQENKEDTSNLEEKGVFKNNQNTAQNDGRPKKELRFSDTPFVEEQSPQQFSRGSRRGFRGRNIRRGNGIPRETDRKIENPINIKIELSIETGLRNCTLDKDTKIPDIKHVPDQISYEKSSRRGSRGTRGVFRGRGRGRGSFARGSSSYKGREREPKTDVVGNEDSFNMEELQKNLPDAMVKVKPVENGNIQLENNSFDENDEETEGQDAETQEIFERYDDYDQDNEEYNDANENYEDEFSSEYYSEYHNDSTEKAQKIDNRENFQVCSGLPESERYDQGGSEIIDSNLKKTITITSSKFQEKEVQRCIEVLPKNDEAEKGGS